MNYSRQYYEAARYMAETGCTIANQAVSAVAEPRTAGHAVASMWAYVVVNSGETIANLTPEEKILWLLFLSEAEKERK